MSVPVGAVAVDTVAVVSAAVVAFVVSNSLHPTAAIPSGPGVPTRTAVAAASLSFRSPFVFSVDRGAMNCISRADRFESETQIKGSLLRALGFLEHACEINHTRYS